MRPFIICLIFLVLATGSCIAEELKDENQKLIGTCKDEAAVYFNSMDGKHEGVDKDGTTTIAKYKVHYNIKNKICFMLTSVNSFNDKKKINNYSEELSDVNNKHLTGTFIYDMRAKRLILCTVGTSTCSSKVEFDRMVKPYMTQ